MSLLESQHIPLGTPMPSFKLKDPNGEEYDSNFLLDSSNSKGLLVVFTCNHCPYAKAVWPRLIKLAEHARNMSINTVAINPNINPDYPDDSPEEMKKKISEWKIPFPYLIDDTQQVAKAFKALCTPDIYLFDQKGQLIYHGRVDNNWQNERKVTREELKEAINNHVGGLEIDSDQKPSMGCSIKWR